MSNLRLSALQSLQRNRRQYPTPEDYKKLSAYFGENVFDLDAMKDYLAPESLARVIEVMENERRVEFSDAETIATAMRKWAMEHGATHYTHWFHPLTGLTAEKHDSFFKPSFPRSTRGIEKFTGKELLQQEPDASSFPNGGLRGTDEARGYTIWDPTSPAFILEVESGRTLYIPSVFISYTGESLDYKAPLLKAKQALSDTATVICREFLGMTDVKSVTPTLGWEQEYFIVDDLLFNARPDLMLAGRTIMGASAAKGHEKADHYFGSIPERVQRFMHDFEREALRVGIPVQTRHNEVAPGQFECAPMFGEVNVSVDQNLLIMGLMERLAHHHGLRVLFHEKPFAGINGSGKHNNWSLITNTGRNLFDPVGNPASDLPFLTFFIAVLRAMHRHGDLMRASIASAGNDHRLGSNEAPPAILAVFTGSGMEKLLNDFVTNGFQEGLEPEPKKALHHGVHNLPEVFTDVTDRNRTSSFPFIGNRFEFRAVGATATPAFPQTVLNTMTAASLTELKNRANEKGGTREAFLATLQELMKESLRVVFNGDNYSDAWRIEAEKRGLKNESRAPYALDFLLTPEARKLFEAHQVYSTSELEAVVSVLKDNYLRDVQTEAFLYEELVKTHVIPAAVDYSNRLINSYRGYQEMGLDESAAAIKRSVDNIATHLNQIRRNVDDLEERRKQADEVVERGEVHEGARLYVDTVKPLFASIRQAADSLEVLIDDRDWRLPKYRELLFIH